MSSASKSIRSRLRPQLRSRLSIEELEAREVPATLAPISDFTTPNTKALFVPLSLTSSTGTVTYTATSTDPLVQVQIVQGGTTITMNVTGPTQRRCIHRRPDLPPLR